MLTSEKYPPEPHSLWFPNAPPTATPALIAANILGGPLESVRWFEHYHDDGLSFLINFLDHRAAAAFLSFTKHAAFKMRFPGVEEGWRPFITWSNNINGIRASILRAASSPVDPARRVLVFHNFPATVVTKHEMKKRLKVLERQCLVEHWVDTYEVYPSRAVAYIVFSKIESAMRVMGWHKMGYLGPEFDGCEVVYGRDPSDRPIPKVEDNSTAPPPPPPPPHPPVHHPRPSPTAPLLPTPPTPPSTIGPESSKLIDVPVWIAPRSPAPPAAPRFRRSGQSRLSDIGPSPGRLATTTTTVDNSPDVFFGP